MQSKEGRAKGMVARVGWGRCKEGRAKGMVARVGRGREGTRCRPKDFRALLALARLACRLTTSSYARLWLRLYNTASQHPPPRSGFHQGRADNDVNTPAHRPD